MEVQSSMIIPNQLRLFQSPFSKNGIFPTYSFQIIKISACAFSIHTKFPAIPNFFYVHSRFGLTRLDCKQESLSEDEQSLF